MGTKLLAIFAALCLAFSLCFRTSARHQTTFQRQKPQGLGGTGEQHLVECGRRFAQGQKWPQQKGFYPLDQKIPTKMSFCSWNSGWARERWIPAFFFVRMPNPIPKIQIGESGSLQRDMTCSPYVPGQGYPLEAQKHQAVAESQRLEQNVHLGGRQSIPD
jgi:hypothetical protein